MRQIKFKGQRLTDSKWIYGYYFTNQEERWVNGSYHGKHFIKSINNGIDFEVIPETVCEFTGLKDINGIDIYEGDIIKLSAKSESKLGKIDKEWNVAVAWNDLECSFKLQSYARGLSWNLNDRDFNGKIFTKEVIGNIYDNSELLK